jgi:hypothetical protein
MPNIATLKKKERKMDTQIVSVSILVLTLLNLGLVMIALARLNGLRRDLRTPVVKKFNSDFKRKSVDIPKTPENFGKTQHDKPHSRVGNQQSLAQNRPKNNSQQNRPMQIRRPAVKAPDVFSNETSAAPSPVPPRPIAAEPAPTAEGRRPLPPRYNAVANATAPVSFGTAPAELAPMAPAPISPVANDNGEGAGMEFDRSKMAHGRRNVVAKPVIEDEGVEA